MHHPVQSGQFQPIMPLEKVSCIVIARVTASKYVDGILPPRGWVVCSYY